MTLLLLREPSRDGSTLGSLYVDGRWQCWTLEDEIRERPDVEVGAWKIPGQTAIPAGEYRLDITPSKRFNRPMPLLLDVPGFDGIRFHWGNRSADTEGCVIVGRERYYSTVGESRAAFERLFTILDAHVRSEATTIRVMNPGEWQERKPDHV